MTVFAVHGVAHFGQHAVHHLVAIVQGELLRPVQVAHVRVECRMLLRQVGKIAIGQPHAHLLTEVLGHPDVVHADLVADPA